MLIQLKSYKKKLAKNLFIFFALTLAYFVLLDFKVI